MADGTKVGDVYVEGRLEYDDKSTPAFMAAMQRDLRRRLPDITNTVKQHFDTEFDRSGTSAGDKFGSSLSASLRRSLDKLKLRAPDLDLNIDGAMADIAR